MPVRDTAAPRLALVYALLVLATLFWGGTAVAGKLAIQGLPPLTTGALRYGAATLVLLTVFWRQLPSPAALRRRDVRLIVAVGVLGTLLNHTFFFFALVWAPAAHGSIVPPKLAMQRLSPTATLALGMIVGTTLIAPLALLERPWRTIPQAAAPSWMALGYLVVASTVLSFLWWNLGIRRVGPGRTAVFSNLVPVFGVGIAWLVLGERLSPIQLVGGALAVLGVIACQRRP